MKIDETRYLTSDEKQALLDGACFIFMTVLQRYCSTAYELNTTKHTFEWWKIAQKYPVTPIGFARNDIDLQDGVVSSIKYNNVFMFNTVDILNENSFIPDIMASSLMNTIERRTLGNAQLFSLLALSSIIEDGVIHGRAKAY